MWYSSLLEKNLIPDPLIRKGIRDLLKQRLLTENKGNVEAQQAHLMRFIEALKTPPATVNAAVKKEQVYEVPVEFYKYCFGQHLKHSCCLWNDGVLDINMAEQEMLELTCKRAALENGQQVLELGCGWGSLSLFMAARYPASSFTAVTDSPAQKQYISEQAEQRGITNIKIVSSEMYALNLSGQFDRVISVEMFEHIGNYQQLLKMIGHALKPEGKLFIHIFTHKEFAYRFDATDNTNLVSRYFFTGGIMPSDKLLFYFNDDVKIQAHWHVSGLHYQKTAEAWLSNMDANKNNILPLFEQTYGKDEAIKWWNYWRIFYMSCAELWGYNNGNEWLVSHYLLKKASA